MTLLGQKGLPHNWWSKKIQSIEIGWLHMNDKLFHWNRSSDSGIQKSRLTSINLFYFLNNDFFTYERIYQPCYFDSEADRIYWLGGDGSPTIPCYFFATSGSVDYRFRFSPSLLSKGQSHNWTSKRKQSRSRKLFKLIRHFSDKTSDPSHPNLMTQLYGPYRAFEKKRRNYRTGWIEHGCFWDKNRF